MSYENTTNTPADVLQLLFEYGPLEQMEAARRLGITKAACNLHIQRLSNDGLIAAQTPESAGRGRPAKRWGVAPDNLFSGVVIGSEKIRMEVMDFCGKSLIRHVMPLEVPGNKSYLDQKLDEVWQIIRQTPGVPRQLFLGVPGAIAADGTILNSPNFTELNGWNPDRELAKRYQTPCFTDTIGWAVNQGETAGVRPDAVTLILNWDEGFGADFSVNGEPLNFPARHAGRYRGIWDFGHIRVIPNGRRCHCGKQGCLEAYIGGVSLLEQHPELTCSTVGELVALLRTGSAAALAAIQPAVTVLIENLYPFLEFFGVEQIVVTGGFRDAFPVLQPLLLTAMSTFYPPEELSRISIRQGGEPDATLPHGAALTARRYFLYPQQTSRYRGLGQVTLRQPSL